MSESRSTGQSLAMTVMCLAGLLGCGGRGSQTPEHNPSLTTRYEEWVVRSELRDRTQVHTRVHAATGDVLLEATWPEIVDGRKYLSYLFTAEQDHGQIPLGATLKVGELNLEAVNKIVLELYLGRMRALQRQSGQDYDRYGCDALAVLDCGMTGRCCDQHDRCIAECASGSTDIGYGGWTCGSCDVDVAGCILSGAWGNAPGQSECCARGNCGQPRPGRGENDAFCNNGLWMGCNPGLVCVDGPAGGRCRPSGAQPYRDYGWDFGWFFNNSYFTYWWDWGWGIGSYSRYQDYWWQRDPDHIGPLLP